jgi:hypothetical protein
LQEQPKELVRLDGPEDVGQQEELESEGWQPEEGGQ